MGASLQKTSESTIKHHLLLHPSDWFLKTEVIDAIKASSPIAGEFYRNMGKSDPKHNPIIDLVREPVKEVYTMPMFSEVFCKLLLDEIKTKDFLSNSEEDELRQIPEIVFKHRFPSLHESLMYVVLSAFNPVFFALWGRNITDGTIQVANYNPREKEGGAWHHDKSADITVVVPLNTGGYEGGGTEFLGRGIVAPLPTGNALIFPSFTHMHKGLPVATGDRYLLVFWLKEADHVTH